MPSCAFMKPVNPSKTLAAFLAENTNLPVLVWWIILKYKYDLEEKTLDMLNSPSGTIHKLRSGNKYISPIDKNSFTDIWFDDSYKLCAEFKNAQSSKVKGSLCHDKMIYNCLLRQINFVMNWSHIVVLNAEMNAIMDKFLKQGLYPSITQIYNDIYKPNIISDPDYKKWCIEMVEDLRHFKNYLRCPCGWRNNPQNKCSHCIDTEQYMFNYDSYNFTNFTVLRSGKRFVKRGGIEKKPVIIQKVYMLV